MGRTSWTSSSASSPARASSGRALVQLRAGCAVRVCAVLLLGGGGRQVLGGRAGARRRAATVREPLAEGGGREQGLEHACCNLHRFTASVVADVIQFCVH